jgi:hypothetical protein
MSIRAIARSSGRTSTSKRVIAHIERAAKPGADARDVTVFRRVWRAADDGPMVASDCELARCEAAP